MAERRGWKFQVARAWLILWGLAFVGQVIGQVGWVLALRVGAFMVFAISLIWAFVIVARTWDDGSGPESDRKTDG